MSSESTSSAPLERNAAPRLLPNGLAAFSIFVWGVFGVIALLVQAMYRLTPLALEPLLERRLTPIQASIYVAWVVTNLYAEGYRGFHKRFSPRVIARALYLAGRPRFTHVLFAPAFCMSLFHATRRAVIAAWSVTTLIVIFILLAPRLPQPWRGILDGGVVVGLAAGTLSILYFFSRALRGEPADVPANLPPA
jgi:hypothetical protein